MAGASGSNECPAGSARIVTEDACRNAVILTGKYANPTFVQTNEFAPRGCYYTTVLNTAYFNEHAAGAGYSGAQLLCAAAAGAPFAPLSPMRARQCTALPHKVLGTYSRVLTSVLTSVLTWVLTCVLTCAALEHSRVCCLCAGREGH